MFGFPTTSGVVGERLKKSKLFYWLVVEIFVRIKVGLRWFPVYVIPKCDIVSRLSKH